MAITDSNHSPQLINRQCLQKIFICLALAGITLAAFWPVTRLGFSLYDDNEYIINNSHIQKGLTIDATAWAFSTDYTGNWHPITWLSHMLDYKLYGLHASGHHWTNLFFHCTNVVMLFLILNKLSQTMWRSTLAAILFAVHPLRVESVAWVSERKDVLSAFFMMLTLWTWTCHIKKIKAGNIKSKTFLFASLVMFTLGLMSKPMLVTLPLILLVLDFWPLQRIQLHEMKVINWLPLLREKIPFFALSAISCFATIEAQNAGGSVVTLSGLPLDWRMANSLNSCACYLEKIFWPQNLALLYPLHLIPTSEILLSAILLAGITAFCAWLAKSQPWLLMGWLWFIIMLIPVIGLVQVGKQAMADRYTYLPSIGIMIMAVWSLQKFAVRSKCLQASAILTGISLTLIYIPMTRHQISYWQNDIALFHHALVVTKEDNYEGYLYLGNAYVGSGNLEAAIQNYNLSLQTTPQETTHLEQARYNLGYIYFSQKKFSEAETQFGAALNMEPGNPDAHLGLGRVLSAQKKYDAAQAEFSAALAAEPGNAAITKALAAATILSESQVALTNYLEILKTNETAEIHAQVAAILTIQENFSEANKHYRAALRLKPDAPDTLNNLAWFLCVCPDANIRNGNEAVKLAEQACELTGYREPTTIGTLAAAYAEAGSFGDAISAAQKAIALATQNGNQALVQKNEQLLLLYRAHRPYHELNNQK